MFYSLPSQINEVLTRTQAHFVFEFHHLALGRCFSRLLQTNLVIFYSHASQISHVLLVRMPILIQISSSCSCPSISTGTDCSFPICTSLPITFSWGALEPGLAAPGIRQARRSTLGTLPLSQRSFGLLEQIEMSV